MPITKKTLADGDGRYATAGLFVGPVDHTDVVNVTGSNFTNVLTDSGHLPAGVPVAANGGTVGADTPVYGVTIEPVHVQDLQDVPVAVATIGQLNRAAAEDNIGRAFTANEVAGFGEPGCLIRLIQ